MRRQLLKFVRTGDEEFARRRIANIRTRYLAEGQQAAAAAAVPAPDAEDGKLEEVSLLPTEEADATPVKPVGAVPQGDLIAALSALRLQVTSLQAEVQQLSAELDEDDE